MNQVVCVCVPCFFAVELCVAGRAGADCAKFAKGFTSPGGPATDVDCTPCPEGFTTDTDGAANCTSESLADLLGASLRVQQQALRLASPRRGVGLGRGKEGGVRWASWLDGRRVKCLGPCSGVEALHAEPTHGRCRSGETDGRCRNCLTSPPK